MNQISEGCRLCLDSFVECFTTIDNPQLKIQMEKVFSFLIEPKQGYCSGVCQSCSYAISEFYHYSEKVRQNQEVLNGNVTNFDPTVDFKSGIFETLSETMLPETIKDTWEVKEAVSQEKAELPTVYSKTALESAEIEPLSASRLLETTEEFCEPKHEVLKEEEEVPNFGDDKSYEPLPKLDDLEADGPQKTSKQAITKARTQKLIEQDELFNKHFRMICDLCGTPAANFTELDSHFRMEHKRRYGYVVCCNKKLFRRYTIRDHIDFHADPNVFRCKMCGIKYKNKETLNAHMLYRHSSEGQGLFKCDLCSQSFEQKAALAQHIKRHIEVKCPKCSKMLSCKEYLSRHMATQHSDKHRTMVCDTCGKEFLTKRSFERHKNEHMGIEVQRLKCGICQRWLKGDKNLRIHMNTVHTDSDQEFQCDICLQKYPHSQALYVHKLRTHAEPKLVCEFCGKKFKKAISLKVHRATHTGEEVQRFQCEICQRWLKGKQSLRNHMNWVHSDSNQELQCDICLQKYPHLGALSMHKFRAHTKPKYECEFCDKKFQVPIALKEHRATHTGEVLYSCEYCGIPNNRKTNLYQHIKRQHPTEWAQKKLKTTQKSGPSLK